MNTVKEICFWIVFTSGLIICLLGLGMLLDNLVRRYMVYKNIYDEFLDFYRSKMKKERTSRQ